MTREELIEVIVQRMAESECGPASLHGHAYAALAALEAAGVRLVPVEARVDMFRALTGKWGADWEAKQKIGQWALGSFAEDYQAMLSASPYALKEPGANEVFQELAKKQEPLGAEFEAAIGDLSTLYET